MNKIEEIFKAWGIMFNPNDAQSELAAARMEICDGCEFKETIPFNRCSVCGCALKAKVYSPKMGACPKAKWMEIEHNWYQQNNKAIYDKLKNGNE
jgi:rubredoxin